MRRRLTGSELRLADASERAIAAGAGGRDAPARVPVAQRATPPALGAARPRCPLNLLLGEAAKREALAAGMPSPQNMPIDHFVVLMMENRSFDHYFGWLPNADAVQQRTYPDPDNGGAPVRTRHASTLGEARVAGLRASRPRPLVGGRARRSSAAPAPNPKREPDGFLAGDNDEFALCYYDEGDLGFIHPAGREFTVYDRFHCSLMASTWPNRYYMWSAQSGGRTRQQPAGRHARQPVGDALRPRAEGQPGKRSRQGADGPLLQLRPAVLGGVGGARRAVDAARGRLLRGLRGGDASQHQLRGPALPRRRGRRRRLGGRAPARRRAARPGLHVRRRARVHRVAELGAGRAVHRLRRVGRLLRPRPAAQRSRRPPQLEHRPGLRADGLPDPGGGGLAVRQARRGQPPAERLRVDHQADHLPLRAGQPHDSRRAGPEHRPDHELDAARTSSGPTCPTRTASSRAPARSAAATCWTASRRTRATSPRSRTSPSASASRPAPARPTDIFREPDSLQKALA